MQISKLWLAVGLLLLGVPAWAQLKLPFFDDFSTSGQTPSLVRWLPGSNVYINNTLTTDQPSVNIATFDGLKADGSPYSFTNAAGQGETDVLTSQPIDLAGLTIADSLYLSFYWQYRGLGDRPDPEDKDSLVVEFLGNNRAWVKVWPTSKADSAAYYNNRAVGFRRRLVPVDRERYFHSGFQFRFRSRGRLSGAFDQWHVDYIYLNKGRSAVDTAVTDVAVRTPITPLLRRYTAMPLRQFLARPTAELAETVHTRTQNLNRREPTGITVFDAFLSWYGILDDRGQVIQDTTNLGLLLLPGQKDTTLSARPLAARLATLTGKTTLRSRFFIGTVGNQNTSIPGVDLRQNDTIVGTTVLDNYYAYDDGSAEISRWINQRFAQTAVRFIKTLPDAVKGISIHIPPVLADQTGQFIAFSIFNDAGNNTPSTQRLQQQQFPIKYATLRNGFVDYIFDRPVNVRDTFYVAYTQLSDQYVPVGFDRNSPFRNNIFINLSTRWETAPAEFQDGAFMIRPIMQGNIVTLATEPETPAAVYPNPSAGLINWAGTLVGSVRLDVTDLAGRTWGSVSLQPNQTTTNLGHLPDGFYLLRFTDAGERTRTVRCIIRK
jgi:hypothetical protein